MNEAAFGCSENLGIRHRVPTGCRGLALNCLCLFLQPCLLSTWHLDMSFTASLGISALKPGLLATKVSFLKCLQPFPEECHHKTTLRLRSGLKPSRSIR